MFVTNTKEIVILNNYSCQSKSFVSGIVASQQQSRRKQCITRPCEMSKKKNIVRERLLKKLKAKKAKKEAEKM